MAVVCDLQMALPVCLPDLGSRYKIYQIDHGGASRLSSPGACTAWMHEDFFSCDFNFRIAKILPHLGCSVFGRNKISQ